MARVLIVDDNPVDRELVVILARHRGHEVLEAPDGVEGWRLALSIKPDVVVTDILMPRLDGYELARRVRMSPELATTRVMFNSAKRVEPSLTVAAAACGVSRIVSKPSEPEVFLQTLDEVLAAPPDTPTASNPEDFDRAHQTVLNQALLEKVDELERLNEQLSNTQALLRTSQERLDLVIRQLPAAIWTTDSDLRCLSIAGQLMQAIGLSEEEVVGHRLQDILGIEDEDYVSIAAHRKAVLGEPCTYVSEWRGRSFETRVEPMRDATDDIVGTVSVSLDISERMQAETERANLKAKLEQAQRLESIGLLAGGVAHDFNNLLAVIVNYAAFAAEADIAPEVRADIEEIVTASERAAALTKQLLIFSRREPSQPQTLELTDVLEGMNRLLARTLGEHIEFRTALDDDLDMVRVDPRKLEQVILNLAINARDAMPSGGTLTIEAANAAVEEAWPGIDVKPGAYVRVAVRDTGTGMSPEVVERAFEPFYTTKPRGKGTGLGLATAYGIVTEAGGYLVIDSEPGKGTSVSFYLPVATDAASPAPRKEPLDGAGGGRVLLVEDEDSVREIARRILNSDGYQVTAAASPVEAIALIEGGRTAFDILLSDVVMPEMSGRELAKRIHQNRPGLPVLYMSGYPSDLIADVALGKVEGQALLRKPFGKDQLLGAVRSLLAAKDATPAGRHRSTAEAG